MYRFVKTFSIEFVIAFLFGIGGCFTAFYLYVLIDMIIPISVLGDDKTGVFVGMFVGVPIGSSLGVFVTKKFVLKTDGFKILRLTISFVIAFLSGQMFLWPTFLDLIKVIGYYRELAFFPFVTLSALIGYNVIGLLQKTKDLPQ